MKKITFILFASLAIMTGVTMAQSQAGGSSLLETTKPQKVEKLPVAEKIYFTESEALNSAAKNFYTAKVNMETASRETAPAAREEFRNASLQYKQALEAQKAGSTGAFRTRIENELKTLK